MSKNAKQPKLAQKPSAVKEYTNDTGERSSIPEVKTHGEWWRYGGGYTQMFAPLDKING